MSTVVVEKGSPGFAFASATGNFSTERLPAEARGTCSASSGGSSAASSGGTSGCWSPRGGGANRGGGPGGGAAVHPGEARREYVHLRDPRGSGFEPEKLTRATAGTWGWGSTRRSGTAGRELLLRVAAAGEYTFKHRLRAPWPAPSGSPRRPCSPFTRRSLRPTRAARWWRWRGSERGAAHSPVDNSGPVADRSRPRWTGRPPGPDPVAGAGPVLDPATALPGVEADTRRHRSEGGEDDGDRPPRGVQPLVGSATKTRPETWTRSRACSTPSPQPSTRRPRAAGSRRLRDEHQADGVGHRSKRARPPASRPSRRCPALLTGSASRRRPWTRRWRSCSSHPLIPDEPTVMLS